MRMQTFLLLRTSLLDDELVEPELLCGALEHPFLHRFFRDEPENVYLLRLTNSVRAVHRLQVCLRIPVGIVENDDIGGG